MILYALDLDEARALGPRQATLDHEWRLLAPRDASIGGGMRSKTEAPRLHRLRLVCADASAHEVARYEDRPAK